jgi:hypothetical protein
LQRQYAGLDEKAEAFVSWIKRAWLKVGSISFAGDRVITWTVFAIQAVVAVIQWGGHMIDAYGHAQLFFDNRQAIAHAVQSAIAAVFSPTGSIITMIVSGAFLFVDNRAHKHQSIPISQDLSREDVRLPP